MIKKLYPGKIKKYLSTILIHDLLPNIKDSVSVTDNEILDELLIIDGLQENVSPELSIPHNLYNHEKVYIPIKLHHSVLSMIDSIINTNDRLSNVNTCDLTIIVDRLLTILNEIAVCGKSPINISLELVEYRELRKYVNNKHIKKRK